MPVHDEVATFGRGDRTLEDGRRQGRAPMWTSDAIDRLYRQHSFAVFRRCRALLRDEGEARDVMHEVFVSMLERRDGFKGHSSISTYLFSVATNLCLNRIRNHRLRRGQWEQQVVSSFEEQGVRSPESALDITQLWNAVLSETDSITAQIVVFHLIDGFSQTEIAELVKLSRVSVNQRLQRFRANALQTKVMP